MASFELADITSIPGRLAVGPAMNFTLPFPYGATELGRVRAVEIEWGIIYDDIVDEATRKVFESGIDSEQPILHFALEQQDDDLIKRAFPTVVTAGLSRARIDMASNPGMLQASDPIVFGALDPSHPCALFRRPLVYVVRSTMLAVRELGVFPMLVVPTLPSDYATAPGCQVGRVGDLKFS